MSWQRANDLLVHFLSYYHTWLFWVVLCKAVNEYRLYITDPATLFYYSVEFYNSDYIKISCRIQ